MFYKIDSVGISGDFYKLTKSYFSNRFYRVVLNGQTTSWRTILADFPQESILRLLLFVIYINDLTKGLKCSPRVFADDTSISSIAKDNNESAKDLTNDLSWI